MQSNSAYGQNKAPYGRTQAPRSSSATGVATTTDSAPNITITVVSLTPCQHTGNLRAFAEVKFGKWITIKSFRVVQQLGQAAWCGMPSSSREDADAATGEVKKRFFPLIEVPENWKRTAEVAVLAAWDEYQQNGVLPQNGGGQGL
jgi:DNA-binding cell septation regulator SpoVG